MAVKVNITLLPTLGELLFTVLFTPKFEQPKTIFKLVEEVDAPQPQVLIVLTFPKSVHWLPSVSFPATFGAGIVWAKFPSPLQACAGESVPANELFIPAPVVLLLCNVQSAPIFVKAESSQNIWALAIGMGAVTESLIPFLFNSASYKGKLKRPFKNVSAKVTFVPDGTATPKPSNPSQESALLPAGISKPSIILSDVPDWKPATPFKFRKSLTSPGSDVL